MANKTETQVVPIHPTILHWQERMLREEMARRGLLGMSDTLRAILTEWCTLTGWQSIGMQPASVAMTQRYVAAMTNETPNAAEPTGEVETENPELRHSSVAMTQEYVKAMTEGAA